MLAGRFKSGHRALRSSHAEGNHFLSQTSSRTRGKQFLAGHAGQSSHASTVILCKPTKSRFSVDWPCTSRQSSIASRTRTIRSSRDLDCVWQPGSAGTDPTKADSVLKTRIANNRQSSKLSWNTMPGGIYQVQVSGDFTVWTNLGEARFAPGTDDFTTVVHGKRMEVYRVIRLR